MKLTFANWLASAKRGDRFQYYRGVLMHFDRDRDMPPPDAYLAWAAYETGRATLLQKRNGKNDYSYFAVRL